MQAKGDPALSTPKVWPVDAPDDLRTLCLSLLRPSPKDRPRPEAIHESLNMVAAVATLPDDLDVGFVGRKQELERLRATHERTRDGSVLVQLRGDSGIGKSTLVRRFMEEAQMNQSPPLCLSGRAHKREAIAYKGFDGVIDALSRTLSGPLGSEIGIPKHAASLARLFPVMARWLRDVPDEPANEDMDKERARAMNALASTFRALARLRPVVVWVDDLQWADRDTVELIERLMEPHEGRGILLLLSRRRDESPIDEPMAEVVAALPAESAEELPIAPLSTHDQRQLMEQVSGEQSEDAAQAAEELLAQAQGNPLFVIELALFAARHVDRLREGWRPTFEDALLERVASLQEAERALLDALVVAGEPTPLGPLAETAAISADEREDAVIALGRARFCRMMRRGASRWFDSFHDKVRETVSTELGEQRQRALHLALARALAKSGAVTEDRLARHFLAGGAVDEAVGHYESAAKRAREALAFDRAAEYYRMVLEHGAPLRRGENAAQKELELRTLIAECLAGAGLGEESAEAFQGATALASRGDADRLRQRAGAQLLRAGQIEAGQNVLVEVLRGLGIRLARSSWGAIPGLLWGRLMRRIRGMSWRERNAGEDDAQKFAELDLLTSISVSIGLTDMIRGSAMFERLLIRTLDSGDRSRVATALAMWTMFRGAEGLQDHLRIRAAYRDAAALVERGVNAYGHGWFEFAGGFLSTFRGDFASAADSMHRARHYFDEDCVGANFELVMVGWSQVELLATRGEWLRSSALLEELKRHPSLGSKGHRRILRQSMAHTFWFLQRDAPEEAWRSLDDALVGWPRAYTIASWRRTIGQLLITGYESDWERSFAIGKKALRRSHLHLNSFIRILASILCARIMHAAIGLGDRGKLRRAMWRLRFFHTPIFADAHILYGRAALSALRGDRNGAISLLQELLASTTLAEGLLHLAAGTRYRLGELLGDTEAARALRDKGLAFFEREGCAAPLKMLGTCAPPLRLGEPGAGAPQRR